MLFCGDTFLLTQNEESPFDNMAETFQDQMMCLNFETSLKNEVQKKKNICLSVNENALELIPETARILSLVNNHVWDSGNPAKLVRQLEQQGKVVVGPENPAKSNIKLDGLDVDFFSAYFKLPRLCVSYNGSMANVLERMLLNSITDRKIVNLHWGYEHTNTPAPFQRKLAHRLIDAGADIIIGHHPHVPQGEEVYKGKHIYYSLGNFNFWQFDTEPSENNRWGYMVNYDLMSRESQAIPYRINENYQPYPVSCDDKANLRSRLNHLNNSVRTVDDLKWFRTEYDGWYKHELGVWKKLCFSGGSPRLWLKRIAWLCMPMQLKYYGYTLRFKMGSIWRRH